MADDSWPAADYAGAWNELAGYVDQACLDGRHINPCDLLDYMNRLHYQALAPVREWVSQQMPAC